MELRMSAAEQWAASAAPQEEAVILIPGHWELPTKALPEGYLTAMPAGPVEGEGQDSKAEMRRLRMPVEKGGTVNNILGCITREEEEEGAIRPAAI